MKSRVGEQVLPYTRTSTAKYWIHRNTKPPNTRSPHLVATSPFYAMQSRRTARMTNGRTHYTGRILEKGARLPDVAYLKLAICIKLHIYTTGPPDTSCSLLRTIASSVSRALSYDRLLYTRFLITVNIIATPRSCLRPQAVLLRF